MPTFRKKPVEIEAYEFQNKACEPDIRPEWLLKAVGEGLVTFSGRVGAPPTLAIKTLEGTMTAQVGDWIIKGVQGEIYPCKPDIFAATYDHVSSPLSTERNDG